MTIGTSVALGQVRQRQAPNNGAPTRPPLTRDQREDIRDRREDVRDRREDILDRRKIYGTRKETVASVTGGKMFAIVGKDVRDRREDVRDRLEDRIDRNPRFARRLRGLFLRAQVREMRFPVSKVRDSFLPLCTPRRI
jgi:hypothetical protein